MPFRKNFVMLILLGQWACGNPQGYHRSPLSSQVSGPGSYFVPTQVDFLLVVDDSPSLLNQVGPSIIEVIKGFLKELDQQFWDYHFILAPMINKNWSLKRVVGSRYDPSHPEWLPAHLGMTREEAWTQPHIEPSFFIPVRDLQLDFGAISGTQEEGFLGMRRLLEDSRLSLSGFLRPDAFWVLLLMSNGDDVSQVQWEKKLDNSWRWNAQADKKSLLDFQGFFQQQSARSLGLSFYPFVSFREGPCVIGGRSSYATEGRRYRALASSLGGQSFDVCAQKPLSTLFRELAETLKSQRKSLLQRYVVFPLPSYTDPNQLKLFLNGSPLPTCQPNTKPIEETKPCWKYRRLKPDEKIFLIEEPRQLEPVFGKEVPAVLELSRPTWLKSSDHLEIQEFQSEATEISP